MSSWGRGIKVYAKPKVTSVKFYDISNTSEIAQTFLELLISYIYARRLNEKCIIYDPNDFLSSSIRYNPQVKLLTTLPDESTPIQLSSMTSLITPLKFAELRSYAADLFQYLPAFNQPILQVLQKASIRAPFDIAVHLETDASGVILPFYINAVKEYQKRVKKASLTVYVMADKFNSVTQFQKDGDASWTVTALSRFPATDAASAVFQQLAEVQIFAIAPAVVLNFSNTIDRFMYIMQRNPKGYDFFKELNGKPFSLV